MPQIAARVLELALRTLVDRRARKEALCPLEEPVLDVTSCLGLADTEISKVPLGIALGTAASGALEAAAMELRGTQEDAVTFWRMGEELGPRLASLRRLVGSDRRAPAERSLEEASTEWTVRSAEYEERLAKLEYELGRVAAAEQRPTTAFVSALRRRRLETGEKAEALRSALGRAVARLAEDLYAMESHFIYARPRLELQLRHEESGSYFFSVNNECGLEMEDIRALCDINASSKKGRQGVTGHKGIGWKSCFQVSDCPYMLSGAFALKFDIAGPLGQLGYVTPTWVREEELTSLPAEVREGHQRGATVIYLPLRIHSGELHKDHRLCLLFLRRLQQIALGYADGREVELAAEADDSDSSLRSIVRTTRSGQSSLRFLLHKENVDAPGDAGSAARQGCLTLAFPVMIQGPEEDPPLQAIFCCLPVRSVGFRFAVDVHGDTLAPIALRLLASEPSGALWRQVHDRLLGCLQGTACVAVEGGALDLPENCLLRPASGPAREASYLIPTGLLERCLGKRFVERAARVQLEELCFRHWLAILSFCGDGWSEGLSGDALTKPPSERRHFFATLWTFLGMELAREPGEVLPKLWPLRIFPAEEGKLLRLSDGPILRSFHPKVAEESQSRSGPLGHLGVLVNVEDG
ncbi:hypothetical protein AK812_SmicGene35251 [Symbiodinium microadriaticum]|uniref:Protein NO VEIN C-terminal domain-containing protein n=1 Tax=Symbiodinium microadriaticum TaxID=2951 RepID=A0A1Q9CLZ5_SYMMI|nr:hypothetical protein AK812_SmicGene35251 [Symbiodinium microadriaticum]